MIPISPETQQLVDNCAHRKIEHDYNLTDDSAHALKGSMMLAVIALKQELPTIEPGAAELSETQLDGLARTELRMRLSEALDARRCQCHLLAEHGVCTHGIDAQCVGHYESDVPAVGGYLLCGFCYKSSRPATRAR